MTVIATTEDTILAAAKSALGNTVRAVESIGGGWTLDALRRALQSAPGVYVAFLGASNNEAAEGYHDGRFTVYVVTKGADDQARRRGTARVIGAYDIVEQLAARFDGMDIPDIGGLRMKGIDNLFRDAMFDLGGTVYGIQLALPYMPMVYQEDLASLADFVTFHAEHSMAPGDDEPEATDNVTLPQE